MEEKNWRPKMMAIEQDIIEAENISELCVGRKPGDTWFDNQWAYYLSKGNSKSPSGRWVYRMRLVEWKANGNSFKRRPKTGNNSARASQLAALNRNISKSQNNRSITEFTANAELTARAVTSTEEAADP